MDLKIMKIAAVSVALSTMPGVLSATVITGTMFRPYESLPVAVETAPVIKGQVNYFIDGRPATAEEVAALNPDRVSAIEVTKKNNDGDVYLSMPDGNAGFEAEYYLDGVCVDAEAVCSVEHTAIRSITVDKKDGKTTVRLTTR